MQVIPATNNGSFKDFLNTFLELYAQNSWILLEIIEKKISKSRNS